jgi:hypothetical protein
MTVYLDAGSISTQLSRRKQVITTITTVHNKPDLRISIITIYNYTQNNLV